MPLLTVGHGALDRTALGDLLSGAGIETVVDVRRFPGSRRNPDVKSETMADWLAAAGIGYRWDDRLGGRRHLRKGQEAANPDSWWRVAAFRAYAAHTRSPEFQTAMTELVGSAQETSVVVMCSEAVWWRCHRRLIADVGALQFQIPVHHLMHDGSQRPHDPANGARVGEDGVVVWDRDNDDE